MLESITIKNVALIDDITINLQQGLNVITGETGAGKSLVIGSISLLLGDKADKALISFDKNYAYVEAVFSTKKQKVLDIMQEFGLDKENTIVVSRKIFREGKNECRVNGKMFTLSMLKKLVAPLMDLHGQFEHQSILNNDNQLEIIDGLGGKKIFQLKQQFATEFEKYQDIKKQLASFTEDDAERNRLIDLYDFQINEITQANFVDGEEETLKEYRKKVMNIEKISTTLENCSQLAEFGQSGSGSIIENLRQIMNMLSHIRQFSSEYEDLYSRLDSVKIDLSDAIDCINAQKDSLEFNQEEAKLNEERLDLLNSFKKKYGSSIPEINAYLQKVTNESQRLKNSEEYINKLKIDKQKAINSLQEIGDKLSQERKQVAKILETKIRNELQDLAMKNTNFVVEFFRVDLDEANITGLDRVEYLFSANAGQPPKPLNKIISGGEMSRFMLAVKNITADIEDIDTMIFDEIDTGVSGYVAEELAKKLLKIGVKRQVICVSHLSQVASFASSHYYINKQTIGNKTQTYIKYLSPAERIDEVARLIGGTVSSHSVEHAKFMLRNGKEFLKSLK